MRGIDVSWRVSVKKSMIVLCVGRRTSRQRKIAVMEDRKRRVILEDHILPETAGSLTLA